MLIASALVPAVQNSAHAAGTLAGTSIVNVATATYTDDNNTLQSITSNSNSIRVEEVLDVALSPTGAQPLAVVPGEAEYRLSYRLTNSGNGPESYALLANTALGGDAFDPVHIRIVLDSDGDGLYDPLVDSIYTPGSEPLLAPDASLNLFVFVGLPSGVDNGDEGYIDLTTSATTGSGTPGTVFAGAGSGGSDAVVGNTTAEATARSTVLVAANSPNIAKAQSFSPAGTPATGTIVTYTLTADLTGTGISNPVVSDVIPAGTTYVPGSLTLGGAALTDTADADAGAFTGSEIAVTLNAAFVGPQTITFQVEVN